MPARIFKFQTTEQLQTQAAAIGAQLASTSGVTTSLKNAHTGFLIETAKLDCIELQRSLMAIRYELYWRGQGFNQAPVDTVALALEPKNPYEEKVMTAETIQRVANYMLPPFPNYP